MDENTQKKVSQLFERGERLLDDGNELKGLEKLNQAWSLIPEPREKWKLSTLVRATIGDVRFSQKKYKEAKGCFDFCTQSEGGENNAFILMRLGQSLFELGETERANSCLEQAFEKGGEEIFEDEDEKYRQSIQ